MLFKHLDYFELKLILQELDDVDYDYDDFFRIITQSYAEYKCDICGSKFCYFNECIQYDYIHQNQQGYLIDMDSVYPIDIIRQKKINSILNIKD